MFLALQVIRNVGAILISLPHTSGSYLFVCPLIYFIRPIAHKRFTIRQIDRLQTSDQLRSFVPTRDFHHCWINPESENMFRMLVREKILSIDYEKIFVLRWLGLVVMQELL